MKALILVDLQIDFCTGGALAVKDGERVVPIANELMKKFDLIIATKDWHPANHKSFAANHPWRRPGQVIELNGLQQVLWPIHCVQETFGSEFAPGLETENIQHIVYKGTDPEIDSYSGFFDNGHKKATGLADFLKEKTVDEIYLMGLATDYCVKFTALDAVSLGFKTNVITDACRGIDLNPGDIDQALSEMKEKGAVMLLSKDI